MNIVKNKYLIILYFFIIISEIENICNYNIMLIIFQKEMAKSSDLYLIFLC